MNQPRIHYRDDDVTLIAGDACRALAGMATASVDCCVTSPPYFGLRDYGVEGQYGLEPTPEEYVATMVAVFAHVARVLKPDGTLWVNIGDSYAGKANAGETFDRHRGSSHRSGVVAPQRNMLAHAPYKSLLGIPWRVAFGLQADGWAIRNDVIWYKPNAMPESVTDRLSNRHEHLFMLTRSAKYWFDLDPVRETLIRPEALEEGAVFGGKKGRQLADQPGSASRRNGSTYGKAASANLGATGERHTTEDPKGRNPGDVWAVSTQPFPEAHYAVMAPRLAERAILAGCRPGGTVLDPFSGTGTTGMMAQRHGRRYVGIDLDPACHDMALRTRLAQSALIEGTA